MYKMEGFPYHWKINVKINSSVSDSRWKIKVENNLKKGEEVFTLHLLK